MSALVEESLDLLNHGHFQVTDPGPLHAPVRRFSIRRDDKLTLILETEVAADAKSAAVAQPPGLVRFATERVRLVNIAGVEAELIGVITRSSPILPRDSGRSDDVEVAQVHQLTVTPGDPTTAAYTIDWLENFPTSPFSWPDTISTTTTTTTTRTIGLGEEAITIEGSNERGGFGSAAAKLTVAGVTFYVCALGREGTKTGVKPGCIVYPGTPDERFRKKVRTALSFALGVYLVDLGHTFYDRDWRIVLGYARSAYSLGKLAFDMVSEQLAPLGSRFLYQVNRAELNHMVNALVASYDALDLANLSWAYWHARAVTVHIAPAHFGAAIEALQRAYLAGHPEVVSTTILDRREWGELQSALAGAFGAAGLSKDIESTLVGRLHTLNQTAQRKILAGVLRAIGLELGADEDAAWRRRNDAAHGLPIPEGEALAAIRDMKLLRGLFHRMLLRITRAADSYVDYASITHPYRPLQQPPDSQPAAEEERQ
jgi:hypothetical protein